MDLGKGEDSYKKFLFQGERVGESASSRTGSLCCPTQRGSEESHPSLLSRKRPSWHVVNRRLGFSHDHGMLESSAGRATLLHIWRHEGHARYHDCKTGSRGLPSE